MKEILESIRSEKLYKNLLFLIFVFLSSIAIDPVNFSWSFQIISFVSICLILVLIISITQIIGDHLRYWKIFLILGFPFLMDMYIDFGYYKYMYFPIILTVQIVQLLEIYLFICLMYVNIFSKSVTLLFWLVLIYIPELLNVISLNSFGMQMTSEFMCTILNTDFQEMVFALKDYSGYIAVSLFLAFLLCYYASKSKNYPSNKIFSYLSILFFFAGLHTTKWLPIQIIKFSVEQYRLDLKELNDHKETYISIKNIKNRLADKKQTCVLIIGESVDRKHMQIYGYNRETTPYFSKLKKDLFVFRNVKTAYVFTQEAVKSMMYFQNKKTKKINLLRFFQDAGFATFWFSNQGGANPFDNIEKRIAQLCDDYVFLDNFDPKTLFYPKYKDEELLKYLNKALNHPAKKKLIILHLVGSHIPVNVRYPKEFDKFKLTEIYNDKRKAQLVCEYDNSILYTDFVLYKAIDLLKSKEKSDEVSFLLYLSDHGQDIYDTKECNPGARNTIHAYEIPFVVWVSDNYRKLNRDFIGSWNLNKFYKTDRLSYSLIDLARLKQDSIDLSESIFKTSE